MSRVPLPPMSTGAAFPDAVRLTPTHTFSAAPPVTVTITEVPSLRFAKDIEVEETDHGTWILKGMRIFKEGTFKDSMGIQNTWTSMHLDLMIGHYNFLRDAGLFVDVPVRVDHSMSVDKLMGYFRKVYRDPLDPTFLSADLEITEPDHYEKWRRGTYRSRSLEIGIYETNDGAEYFPVIFGVAFVDIGAVEGLHSSSTGKKSAFSHYIVDREDKIVDMNDPRWPAAVKYAAWVEAVNYAHGQALWTAAFQAGRYDEAANLAANLTEWERGATYAAALAAQAPTPPAPVPAPTPTTDHRAPTPTFAFRVGGTTTTDPLVVQQHIDVLQGVVDETKATYRKDFIEDILKSGKITPAMREHTENLIAEMSDSQFSNFRKMYDEAPDNPVLGQHAHQAQGTPGGASAPAVTMERKEILEGIVSQHRNTGMSEDKIQKLDSYKELQRLSGAAA